VNIDAPMPGTLGPTKFATTRWSLILSCSASDTDQKAARIALTELCRIYWRPIFAFICRRGYSVSDAEDLTQDFFLMTIEGNLLTAADPNRGRFRSLLLKALEHFLSDNFDKRAAQKRGGGKEAVPWSDWIAESPSQLATSIRAMESWSAEKIFDLRWAVTITERALTRLAEECESCGRQRMFSILSKYLMADRREISYAEVSVLLGVPACSVAKLLFHLRARYRAILRDEVSQTVEATTDVEDEIRYLCSVLAAAGT
jgi:DNA-directed RNA polymerase specialized sigma24 family protein